jgi:hypothetical protein
MKNFKKEFEILIATKKAPLKKILPEDMKRKYPAIQF